LEAFFLYRVYPNTNRTEKTPQKRDLEASRIEGEGAAGNKDGHLTEFGKKW